jgi:hypothetical protein
MLGRCKLDRKADAPTSIKTDTSAVLDSDSHGNLRKTAVFIGDFGGRDRDRTGDLLVANEEKNLIRRGAATTYAF